MNMNSSAAIDIVEAAYDLEVPAADWLPNVLRAGGPLLDFGLGAYGALSSGTTPEGEPIITQLTSTPGAEELAMNMMRAGQEAGPETVAAASRGVGGKVYTLTDMVGGFPYAVEVIRKHIGCGDLLSLTAIDPDGSGPHISIASKDPMTLDKRERMFWQMLEVHLAAAHRLRRSLSPDAVAGAPLTEIPMQGEALVDPKRFLVAHAVGDAQTAEAAASIRRAARHVDEARGPLRRNDPHEALSLWQGLVRGKWTLVDWFDADGRRFILAKPNSPRIKDPRGLTEREAQVATYAAAGDSNKLIGYRLGLSSSYVSKLLHSAMKKLGVKTQAQLIEKLRGFDEAIPAA